MLRRCHGPSSARRAARGFNLIELMIAMAIQLVILLGIVYVYVGSSGVFRSLEASSVVQENVRVAFERLAFDIRMTGFAGCTTQTVANTLNPAADAWYLHLLDVPLVGYADSVSTFPPSLVGRLRGDALSVIFADASRKAIVDAHDPPSATFHATASTVFDPGELLLATDCSHAALFQMSGPAGGHAATIVHNTGGATSPGNCTKGLGLPVSCANAVGTAYEYQPGSLVMPLAAATYFIGTNGDGEPALYRQSLANVAGAPGTRTEELVTGIEDMHILYGVDTSAVADGAVDAYVTADQVALVAPGADLAAQWARVLAVRVSLVAVSLAGQETNLLAQAYTFANSLQHAPDRKLRRVFTTTIAVRRRL